MKKNLMIAMILVSVVLVLGIVATVSAFSVTGYLVRGGAVATDGVTATLQRVDAGVATVAVTTSSGAIETVRVAEGETVQVGDAQISAFDLEQGWLLKKDAANVEINVFKRGEGGEEFMFAKWECYDGQASSQGGETSCKSSETWQGYAEDFCKGHCNADGTKCGVNSFSVTGECIEPKEECLNYANGQSFVVNGQTVILVINEDKSFYFTDDDGKVISEKFKPSWTGTLNLFGEIIRIRGRGYEDIGSADVINICVLGEVASPPTGGQCVTQNCKWVFNSKSIAAGTGDTLTTGCENIGEIAFEGSCYVSDFSTIKVLGDFAPGTISGADGSGWACEFLNTGQTSNIVETGALCCSV